MNPTVKNAAKQTASNHPVEPPPGAPTWVTAELIGKTLDTWQPYYSDSLSSEDALEIVMGACRLANVLKQIDDEPDSENRKGVQLANRTTRKSV